MDRSQRRLSVTRNDDAREVCGLSRAPIMQRVLARRHTAHRCVQVSEPDVRPRWRRHRHGRGHGLWQHAHSSITSVLSSL
jgi:hypothetical protein